MNSAMVNGEVQWTFILGATVVLLVGMLAAELWMRGGQAVGRRKAEARCLQMQRCTLGGWIAGLSCPAGSLGGEPRDLVIGAVAESRTGQAGQAVAFAADVAQSAREVERLLRIRPRRLAPPEREQMRRVQHPYPLDRRRFGARRLERFTDPGRTFVELAAVEPFAPLLSRFSKRRQRVANLAPELEGTQPHSAWRMGGRPHEPKGEV